VISLTGIAKRTTEQRDKKACQRIMELDWIWEMKKVYDWLVVLYKEHGASCTWAVYCISDRH